MTVLERSVRLVPLALQSSQGELKVSAQSVSLRRSRGDNKTRFKYCQVLRDDPDARQTERNQIGACWRSADKELEDEILFCDGGMVFGSR